MTGTLTITDYSEYHPRQVYSGPFDDEKQLRKLLFKLNGSGYELRVRFDDCAVSEKDRFETVLDSVEFNYETKRF